MIRKQDDIVGSMFHDIAHLIRLRIDEMLKPYDLTRLKWLAIGILSQNEGLTQTGLAQRLELKTAATGKLVDRLVERGLVERRPDPDDRRAHRLFATEKSFALLTELEPLGEDTRNGVLAGLNELEIGALSVVLQKIKSNLTASFAGGATSFALSPDLSLATAMCASV
ncbi:MarR family winged helix-turn-helix transcriptional regulator [Ruegeria arenilitoris]|uniref:MarR family winged helix-turn-helix transcriptional regulator n=1 Tax=Ruegeria arenilitoris TaxID=1173585 RepID=UPI00147E114E|nr:MarR family transcriptional regulator [Ruegeria arenilitoris]